MRRPPYARAAAGEEVTVYEVGPRDGLQNVSGVVPAEAKIAFVGDLLEAGLPAVEVTSFVHPDWVPQLADAAEVFTRIAERFPPKSHRLPVLVPNERGLDRALASGVREIAVFTAATETFSRKNTNATIAETLDRFRPVVDRCGQEGVRVRGYLSVAFGCPYEGPVAPDAVAGITGELFDLGCVEVSVGDTIGVAHPAQVETLVGSLVEEFEAGPLALHFHDTYGMGAANVAAALPLGIRTFDASAGGLGGCPYAPGAAGNLATEDLVYLLEGLGHPTGVDLEGVARAGRRLADTAGLGLPGRVTSALAATGSENEEGGEP